MNNRLSAATANGTHRYQLSSVAAELIRPSYPRGIPPVFRCHGWRGELRRQLVVSSFPVHLRARFGWPTLTPDERWTLAVTRWVRLLTALDHHHAGFGSVDLSALARMRLCLPAGYLLAVDPLRSKDPAYWVHCGHPLCPFCYARDVSKRLKYLNLALSRRPPGAPFWVAPLHTFGKANATSKAVKAQRVAGGVAHRFPVRHDQSLWRGRAVVVTDDPGRLVGLKRRLAVSRRGGLAIALARYLPYPAWWSKATGIRGLVRRLYTDTGDRSGVGQERFSAYGACLDGKAYVPGKGWLDFVGYEGKLEG